MTIDERSSILDGRYVLVEQIARGGTADVWLGVHALLGRRVAIKLLRTDTQRPADPGRLLREARLISALRSAHVVSVLDVGTTESGRPCCVLELLEGVDLYRLVERWGPVPPTRAVHLLSQACDVLAEVHRLGLVHGDVTPGNLVLSRADPGRHELLKLVDFGLAARADAGRHPDDPLVHGTPAFMAPEVVLGHPVDARADVYGLGCVLFWLLTGQLLFEHEDPLSVLVDHVRRAPPPPSSRSALPVPPPLDALAMACLEKDPASRPEDAAQVLQRLEQAGVTGWSRSEAVGWWAGVPGDGDPSDRCLR